MSEPLASEGFDAIGGSEVFAPEQPVKSRGRLAPKLNSRHLANRVEAEVVDALASAVREAYPRLSHRYYEMKARWLGLDKMQHWDRNAPLPQSAERRYRWTEARKTVLDAYGAFSPDMADIAASFFHSHQGELSIDHCGSRCRSKPILYFVLNPSYAAAFPNADDKRC